MCLLQPDKPGYFLRYSVTASPFLSTSLRTITSAAVTSLWALMWMLLIPSGAKLVPPFTKCPLKGTCWSALGKLEPLKTKTKCMRNSSKLISFLCHHQHQWCLHLTDMGPALCCCCVNSDTNVWHCRFFVMVWIYLPVWTSCWYKPHQQKLWNLQSGCHVFRIKVLPNPCQHSRSHSKLWFSIFILI